MINKLKTLRTPCYVTTEAELIKNLEILRKVEIESGCKILLAEKAFSQFSTFPLIGEYISGTTASGLFEAKLGREEMNKENHIFSPAFKESEIDEIVEICDHIVFNSFSQWMKFKEKVSGKISAGIRINPEKSTQDHGIYDPCSEFSRFGVTTRHFKEELIDGIDGLHFHTLCEQNVDALEITLEAVEENFGKYLHKMKWLNLGGGHHITREDYDVDKLINIIRRLKEKYSLEIYLEPGEAIALNAGYLVTEVLEKVENGMEILILDASAACHMPDVIEMPYRPNIIGAGKSGEKKYTYRLGGNTCLAGDIIGDYSFDEPLKIGDKLIFEDMAIYSMVKNNTFNGVNLPDIYLLDKYDDIKAHKSFSYTDFKTRLS